MISDQIVHTMVNQHDVCVQISDQYFTALTPAGYAFSIWLVIWGVQLTAVIWLLYRPDDSDTTVPSLPHP